MLVIRTRWSSPQDANLTWLLPSLTPSSSSLGTTAQARRRIAAPCRLYSGAAHILLTPAQSYHLLTISLHKMLQIDN